MSPLCVARSPTWPVVLSVTAATPLASVAAPPTAAPWTGLVVVCAAYGGDESYVVTFSVTVTLKAAPFCAELGTLRYIGLSGVPDSGSGANSTSSPDASSSAHAPLPGTPLTNSP
jgi:hypothetical protein